MTMDQLWAPWRMAYVEKPAQPPEGECFICRGLAESEDEKNQIVKRTLNSVVLLNKFPYNNGHLLIAPTKHWSNLDQIDSVAMLDIMDSLRLMIRILEKKMKPDGFNVGLNLGRAAGAGLPGHVHWHLVPRWNGDTNFMPILADTKVIVQSLDYLYKMLSCECHPDQEK